MPAPGGTAACAPWTLAGHLPQRPTGPIGVGPIARIRFSPLLPLRTQVEPAGRENTASPMDQPAVWRRRNAASDGVRLSVTTSACSRSAHPRPPRVLDEHEGSLLVSGILA